MGMPARLLLLVGIVLGLALSSTGAAWAHAQLLTTDPAENAVLGAAPEQITLTFNEPVTPLTLRLIGPDGGPSDITDEAIGGEHVTVTLPAELDGGTYVLSWRVVSTDGHPIGSSLVFSIGQVTGAAAVSTGDSSVAIALWIGKALLFVAMFVGIGGAVFAAMIPLPHGARGVAGALCTLGILLAPATLALHGLDALALPLSSGLDGAAWSAAFSTSYGCTAIVACLAFLVALCGLSTHRNRAAIGLGLLAGTLAALSLTLSGHASAAAPQWLMRPAVFLHICGILFWVGALFPLWLLLRDPRETANRALALFSRCVPYAVAPLLLSGMTLAAVQMGIPSTRWLSPYGLILTAKLGLLAALFTLALWNRRWLTGPVLTGETVARRRLRQSIAFEMGIVVVILGLVSGWRFTPPPRALVLAPLQSVVADPVLIHLKDASTMAMVTISPGQAGAVAVDIAVMDVQGTPKDAQSIAIAMSSPALGIEPIHRDAVASGDGWVIEGLTIPVAGDWMIELDMRIGRFELTRLQTEFAIP